MTSTCFSWLSLALALGSGAVSMATSVARADGSAALAIGTFAHAGEDGRWSVREIEPGIRYAVACHERGCEGDLIDISVTVDQAQSCNAAFVARQAAIAEPTDDGIRFSQIVRPGFTIEVALVELGCRNWTGSPVFACAAVGDEVYAFTAFAGGCRETPPEFDKPVVEFLNGLVLSQN